VYEKITKFFTYLKKNLPHLNVVGSEYLGFDKIKGIEYNGIRHEDAMDLSFKDESFDLMISNDVYEHVPDLEAALINAYKKLKNNGRLLFTIPFHENEEKTQIRATIEEDKLTFIKEKQYHGNPIDKKGSLVFYDIGWDVLNKLLKTGFNDAYVISYYSLFYGYIGGGLQIMFVAEK